jgi:hypothetical protein
VARNTVLNLRIAIVCFVMALSAGCATVDQARDGEALKPNQGLLALYVISNSDAILMYKDNASEAAFGTRFSENLKGTTGVVPIKAGKNYVLVPANAGEYVFSKFGAHPRYGQVESTSRFKVTANSITYLGHIRAHVTEMGFKLQTVDRELDMRTYLADAYPMYFKSMDVQKSVVQFDPH